MGPLDGSLSLDLHYVTAWCLLGSLRRLSATGSWQFIPFIICGRSSQSLSDWMGSVFVLPSDDLQGLNLGFPCSI